jgi:hypothetical protein
MLLAQRKETARDTEPESTATGRQPANLRISQPYLLSTN